ncbi:hypothetical protein [Aurantimonas sp. Leaf443]|uniref:hypothetical protein n=1 Tax=Aurantimonas sp. Leaf443 TaxID=1736378 RepID=UPI0007002107|nr:hypothetical protein [Aurantimonas sp. Leaf443]KQT88176.1 hypothetical protein ASG48_01670 [Aurantimonas sp. Leaf443]
MGDTHPDLLSRLPLRAGDTVSILGTRALRKGPGSGLHHVALVTHRGAGIHCHVYLVPAELRAGRAEVRLAAVFPAAAFAEAERYARGLADAPAEARAALAA